jgi:hypothetical protein
LDLIDEKGRLGHGGFSVYPAPADSLATVSEAICKTR